MGTAVFMIGLLGMVAGLIGLIYPPALHLRKRIHAIGIGILSFIALIIGVAMSPPAAREVVSAPTPTQAALRETPAAVAATGAPATAMPAVPTPATIIAAPATQPAELNGTGQSVADVTLPAGLVRFSMKHTGTRAFAVELMDGSGKRLREAGLSESLLGNGVGSWSGEKAVTVEKAGAYVLQVTADGPWQIVVRQ